MRAPRGPVLLILLAAGPVLAVSRQIVVEVKPEKVRFDEQIRMKVTVPGRCYVEPFTDTPQYQIVGKTERTRAALGRVKSGFSSTRFEHQTAANDVEFNLILRPMKTGTITIKPIIGRCGDIVIESLPRTILVTGQPPAAPAAPAPRPVKKEEDGALSDVPPNLQTYALSAPEPQPQPVLEDPVGTTLLRAPAPPAADPPEKKTLSELAQLKRDSAEFLTPERKQQLIRLGKAFLGPILLMFVVPWGAMVKRLRDMGKTPFARKEPLPSISIHREEGVIGGKYKLEKEIGAGGMGLVYLASDLKLGRKVAVKKMRSELQFSTEQRQNFMREAMIISRLAHPYIVAIHEIIEQDGDIYMIFDYVDGKSLSAIIDENKTLTLKHCQEIFSYVCQAVDFAHKNNVLHQDLKPSNIMVDANGFAKVMDFGLAREAKVSTNELWGTLAYMSPERHMGAGTALSDVYSLGVCLYEMLTGGLPFSGPEFQPQKEGMEYVPLTKRRPDLPAAIDTLMAAALAPAPKDRLQGALQLLEELKKITPEGGFSGPKGKG